MNIRDIVNRDIVNLDNCEQEPIHIPGSIQPHGCLMAIKNSSGVIDFCSGNAAEYIGLAYDQLLGKTLQDALGAEIQQQVAAHIASMPTTSPLILQVNDQRMFCNVHQADDNNDVYILEMEPLLEEQQQFPDVYNQTRQFLAYMEQSITLQQLCQLVANRTRQLTGYDRVMIYRFDEEYNGEVFAEAVREDLEPFLGLHYPHTDIPVQARNLYMKNLLRIITDIGYTPVPVYTIDDAQNKNLDMGMAVLRSTSPIHVQYLQNMGVGASLTISLIHKQRLWGLIACHHYSAKNISPNVRIAAQLQAHFIVSQIDMREATEEYDVSQKTNAAVDSTVAFTKTSDTFNSIAHSRHILDICHAGGVAIFFRNELSTGGSTPPQEIIKRLARDLAARQPQASMHTTHIVSDYPYMKGYSHVAAGLIYHPLSQMNEDCIIWFRPESVMEVHWGGDPNKAIIKDEKGLHPRKSFELWQEIVKDRCNPWLKPELTAAANYAVALQKHMALLIISANEQRYRELSERLKLYNDELENINWISTHDLQEPLRKIQLMASRILSLNDEPIPPSVLDLIHRMDVSARRMQTLLKDILNYTKIRYNQEEFKAIALQDIIAQVTADLDDKTKDIGAGINVGPLPQIKGVPFLLTQLFANLISNSLKFADKERHQQITISAQPQHEQNGVQYHHIVVGDTGIGFDEKYAPSIFKIFSRLNNRAEYEGSGVGLALCRKIMETHRGHIVAKGTEGEGAQFHLYFPV